MSADGERWLSKKEAAATAAVSEKTISRWIKFGALRRAPVKVKRVLIAYSDLVRCMNGNPARGA